ncbi:hypothetical protein ACOSQ4_011153 [Xanthoceras sorbifolium]
MLLSKPCDTPLCPSTKLSLQCGTPFPNPTLYRSTIRALQYLTYISPDIAFAVNKLSQFLAAPTDVHWQSCKCILRYLKGSASLDLLFRPAPQLYIEAYTDTD